MLKPLVGAAAVLAIAGSTFVYAQQSSNGPDSGNGPRFEHQHRHRLSAEDRAAFADARIAALKAGLELTADQAKNWPAFEQALRDMVQLRSQLRAAREAAREQHSPPTTPFDRLTRRADNMAKVSAAMKRIADSGAPLYMSLDDAQKGRFMKLARMLRPHHHHLHGRFGGWRGEHRFGSEGGGWRERHFGYEGGRDGHWGEWSEQTGRGPDGRIHELSGEERGSQL